MTPAFCLETFLFSTEEKVRSQTCRTDQKKSPESTLQQPTLIRNTVIASTLSDSEN